MLIRIPFLREAAEIVLAHQEYYDGSGYPRGLKGEEIPLGARIFAVADAVDAMISDRPYRKALSIDHARGEVARCCGSQFDPKVVEVFLSLPDSLWMELRENVTQELLACHLRLSRLVLRTASALTLRKSSPECSIPPKGAVSQNGIGADQDSVDDRLLRLHPRLLRAGQPA